MRVKLLTVPAPKFVLALLGMLALTVLAGPAYAGGFTWHITCDGATNGQLSGAIYGTSPWTSPAVTQAVTAGDTIEITNICVGDIQTVVPGLTFTNHINSVTRQSDGIEGQLALGNVAGELTFATGTTLINGIILESSGASDFANLYIYGGSVTMQGCEVAYALHDGIYITGGGVLLLIADTINNNGQAGVAGFDNGINLAGGTLLDETGGTPSLIELNGGYGIYGLSDSTLFSQYPVGGRNAIGLQNTNVESDAAGEIYVFGALLNIKGGTFSSSSGTGPVIQALGASSVLLNGATVSGPKGAILVANATGLTLANSTISTTSTTIPAVEASGASSVVITGGDTITASATGATAIAIDHSSTLMHRPLSTVLPGETNTQESIIGAGVVQEQSSMDLGQGLVSGSPSITWTTGSNGIQVQQNSSFRVSGGVSITGAVTITQGSNAFANTANGGTNAITSANCPFTTVPSSHWASPAKVTPAVPSATSFASATSPQCLPF